MNNKKYLKEIKRYLFMVVGCLCYAASLGVFLIPNEIVGGGVSGAASLIQILTGVASGYIYSVNKRAYFVIARHDFI